VRGTVQLYLKPEGGPKVLFSVSDESGRLLYEVCGEYLSLGQRFTLRIPDGGTAAKLTGVCLPGMYRFIAVSGTRRLRIWVRTHPPHRTVQLKGMSWRFRGSLLTRSFDVVKDRRGSSEPPVVMTHGRCWMGRSECYAVTVEQEADVPLALCVAVAIDSAALNGCAPPIPVG
jgi:uncharacterized protein YxjI